MKYICQGCVGAHPDTAPKVGRRCCAALIYKSERSDVFAGVALASLRSPALKLRQSRSFAPPISGAVSGCARCMEPSKLETMSESERSATLDKKSERRCRIVRTPNDQLV